MAARLYTVEEAKKNGVDLVYVNTRDIADVNKELRKYSEKDLMMSLSLHQMKKW